MFGNKAQRSINCAEYWFGFWSWRSEPCSGPNTENVKQKREERPDKPKEPDLPCADSESCDTVWVASLVASFMSEG